MTGPPLALLLLMLLTSQKCHASGGAEFEAGTATEKVVVLTKANFKQATQDPANSFWLLKFFAPWSVQQPMCYYYYYY